MSSCIILNLGLGNVTEGCRNVTAKFIPAAGQVTTQCRGSLPPAPHLAKLYRNWQLLYKAFYRWQGRPSSQGGASTLTREIAFKAGGLTNFSEVEFRDLCQQLKQDLNTWLNAESFQTIRQKIGQVFAPTDEISLVLETDDPLLRRLPWHLWSIFDDYPQAEIALSTLEYGRSHAQARAPSGEIRILAIFGDSEGLNLDADRQAIQALPGAVPVFLDAPDHHQFDESLWDAQGWDLLFFAGHSQTDAQTGTGQIQINATDCLTLTQLKHALRQAIRLGLKLAIFNSCDGLGLVQDLADWDIPQMIVMRELVPDVVAQEFFKHFLEAFAAGQGVTTAVRAARERLEKFEDQYPCATWLPVLCHNPTTEFTTWQQWRGAKNHPSAPIRHLLRFPRLVLMTLVVTACVMSVRQWGLLQPWELASYDLLMRQRPEEGRDERFLIVTVTEADLNARPTQRVGADSLPDAQLITLLKQLESYQPRTIGLDIYRPDAQSPIQPDLKTYLQRDRFFGICQQSEAETADRPGIAPPPLIPRERQGFSDVIKDPDQVLRRALLAMQPDPASPCQTEYALSARLAFHYLEQEGMAVTYTENNQLQIGTTRFERLPAPGEHHSNNAILSALTLRRGGFQRTDTRGYQTLLNYRFHQSLLESFPTVTLQDVLENRLSADRIKDRIILIGVAGNQDVHSTPYSHQSSQRPVPGVIIQAQITSQILSAVLDGRPLLSTWPLWSEILWVWGWSTAGGILYWCCRTRRLLLLAAGIGLAGGLYGLCWGLFVQGLWLPLIPTALGVVVTGSYLTGRSALSSAQRQ